MPILYISDREQLTDDKSAVMAVTLSNKNGGPSPECSTIPLPYNLKPDIGIFFNTNKLVLKLQSMQAFMSLPAHLDDGEKRLCVVFWVLQDVICKRKVKELKWQERDLQCSVSLPVKINVTTTSLRMWL